MMHPQHFDATTAVYGNSLYGPVTGYDPSSSASIKFQHPGYMTSDGHDAASCYSNYVSAPNLQSLQGYGMRGDPPPPVYSDTGSFFHPGIVSNFGSPTPPSSLSSSSSSSSFFYNKPISRPTDIIGDYTSTLHSLTPKTPESFLMKPPDPLNSCVSPHDYNNSNSNNENGNDPVNIHNHNNDVTNTSNCHQHHHTTTTNTTTGSNMTDHHLHPHHHQLHTLTPFHHHQHQQQQQQQLHQHHPHHHLPPHLQLPNLYHDENVPTNHQTDSPSKLTNHSMSFFDTTTNPTTPTTTTPTSNNQLDAHNANSDLKMDAHVKLEHLHTPDTCHETDHTNPHTPCNNHHHHNNITTTTLPIPETTTPKSLHDNHNVSSTSSSSSSSSSASTPVHNHHTTTQHNQGEDNNHDNDTRDLKQTLDKQTDATSGGTNDKKEDGDGKPTMSYIALIAKAILESDQRRLNLGAIYGWIEKHYPFYKTKGQGWRNSVRHNLSLNDCFIKAGRCEDGKGNYWAIHPANIQDFIRGDFRQRRRSRRRGRKKECDLGMYHVANGYLQPGNTPLASQMALNSATLSSIYSPYTEAERRAYRLDEALLRQSMNNPFVKWYQHGVTSPGSAVAGGSPTCSPAGMYATNATGPMQWTQGYPDATSATHAAAQGMYPPSLNTSFSRQYPSAPVL